MEALSFMKFWLTNNTTTVKPRREIRISESAVESTTALGDSEIELCEGDDSFFELEISLFDFSHNETKNPKEKEEKQTISKSKILPFVEIPSPKLQQSPNTLLKSGQKFRAFSFKKSKSIDSEKSTTTVTNGNNRSFNVRFRVDDETSFRKTTSIARSQLSDDMVFEDSVSPVSTLSSSSSSSSKRFFSLIKPLYTKTAKKQSNSGVSSSITSPTSSPAAREKQRSNIPSGIRSVRRQLGKSRSASAAIGGMSPANRVNESLQVQQDGIQSAILHCKKSFHGSRESSLLSRSTSESSSQEKLSTSSSEDSYLFSRMSSDSMSEKSIDSLTSIKEQREKISD